MAINRLLYSSQTALITTCGYLYETAGTPPTYDFRTNKSPVAKTSLSDDGTANVGTGFDMLRNYLLPVQTISADETIPMEDVLVLGKKGGAARLQKDVATSKCTIKSYLADWMRWYDTGAFFDDGVNRWTVSSDPSGDPDGSESQDYDDGTGRKIDYQSAESHGGSGASNSGGLDFPTADDAAAQASPPGLQLYAANMGPWPGITEEGMLAGEALVQNGFATGALMARLGMIEQLAWESMGGFESLIQLFRPDTVAGSANNDGFSFFGIMSSLSIDASKGAYPTLDLSFEGVGALEYLNMGTTDDTGTALLTENAGAWYVDACNPHTSDDVLVWGRQKAYGADGILLTGQDTPVLIASNENSFYQDEAVIGGAGVGNGLDRYGDAVALTDLEAVLNAGDGTAGRQAGDVGQGSADTINSAKFSYDMPTETLSNLGAVIEGKSTLVRVGNQQFSKPPYKANMTLDGQGLRMAGWEKVSGGVIREQVIPNEIQIGKLHSVIGKNNVGVSSRSFSQNVGDVGATYNVSAEGTSAHFRATYQGATRHTT